MPSRRAVLATTGAALVAGCLTSTGDPGATDVPDDQRSPTGDTHTGESRVVDGCSAGVDVVTGPFDPAEGLTYHLADRERSLVAEAVESGAAEVTTYADTSPVDDGVYVEHGGTYYESVARRVDSTEVPAVVANIEWERGLEPPDDADVVAFDDLPSADREALRYGVYGGPFDRERQGHPEESLSLRGVPLPYPGGTDDAALVTGRGTWVRWNDRSYRVWTDGETTRSRHRFRLAVTEVAGNADAFRAFVADEYLLMLSGLSDAEREILRAAADDRYEECAPDSDGMASLRDRLVEDARLPAPQYATWYVAFEGEKYALTIHTWVQ